MALENMKFSSDNWRWSGEPVAVFFGLHASVLAIPVVAFFGALIYQFSKISLFWPILTACLVYLAASVLAKVMKYSPRDMLEAVILRYIFNGRYPL